MTGIGTPSFWQRDAADLLPRWPTLDQAPQAHVDVLIVGAGLAGCSAARELISQGRSVLVVDAQGPGAGASGRNAGFVMLGNAIDYPEHVRVHGREHARLLVELGRRNHRDIREQFGDRCEHDPCGSLMLAELDDPAAQATLDEAATLLGEDGVALELGDPPPGLVGFARALTVHDDATLHPGKLLAALAEGLEGRQGHVQAIDDRAGVARIDDHDLHFDRVLICANAFTRTLVPELESWLTPQRAQVLLTEPIARVLDRPCYAGWGFDYFRQLADGSLLLGGRRHLFLDDEQTGEAEPSEGIQRALDEYRARHLPSSMSAKVRARWAGIMGFCRDGLPLIGMLPGRERIAVLTGFTGHGLGMAAACGRLVGRRLVDRLAEDDAALVGLFDAGRVSAV